MAALRARRGGVRALPMLALVAILASVLTPHTAAQRAETRRSAPAAGSAAARPPALIAPGEVLLETMRGRFEVVTLAGRPVRPAPAIVKQGRWTQIEIAPGGRRAYVATEGSETRPRELYELDLAEGRRRLIAHGFAPTVSPDGSELAYLETSEATGLESVSALVLRNLRTGARRSLPVTAPFAPGTPPEWIINFSPDGRELALVGSGGTLVVEPSSAAAIGPQKAIRGLAPAFLDASTLIVLGNCCIGRQQLQSVNLSTGAREPFAELSSPTEFIRPIGSGRFLVLNAERELLIVERGRTHVIAARLLSVGFRAPRRPST